MSHVLPSLGKRMVGWREIHDFFSQSGGSGSRVSAKKIEEKNTAKISNFPIF
jgi:hypothetical protein